MDLLDFSSIRLNLFKKVEYYLILEELDTQFYIQLDFLAKESLKSPQNYPSWGVEKKILFWSYIYHKYWGDIVKGSHLTLKGMFITKSEIKGSIFHNLEAKGFGEMKEDGIVLNGRGRDFGNLLWYLYDVKKCKPDKTDVYKEVYGADYDLKKNFFGFMVLRFQLAALVLLMLFTASFVILEILDSVNLLDNLTAVFKLRHW